MRRNRVAAASFAVWVILTVGGGLVRPGMVLELALIGAAGAGAWLALGDAPISFRGGVVALTCFSIPLLNTWPLRIYDSWSARAPLVAWALLSPASILVAASVALSIRNARPRVPRLVAAAAAAFSIAALASALAAVSITTALAYGWISFIVPSIFGVVVATTLRDTEDGWRWMTIALCAAAVPMWIAVAAYVVDFGVPTGGADLVLAKIRLFRPHLLQDETFGNVLHLADFALIVLPAALVASLVPNRKVTRVVGAVVGFGSLVVLVLVVSRSALVVGAAVAIGLAAAVALVRPRSAAAVPVAALAILVAVSLTPSVRRSFEGLLTTSTPAVAPPITPAPSKRHQPAVHESSETFRVHAARNAWEVFRAHFPLGVGTGEYQRYDPIRTAAHSLPLQLLAENGILGLAALILITLYLARCALGLVTNRGRYRREELLLRAGCVGGALALVGHGAIAGVALTLGAASVWALLLWLLVGILAGLDAQRAPA